MNTKVKMNFPLTVAISWVPCTLSCYELIWNLWLCNVVPQSVSVRQVGAEDGVAHYFSTLADGENWVTSQLGDLAKTIASTVITAILE